MTGTQQVNTAIADHPLVGTEHTYEPDQPPYDPDTDTHGGSLVLGTGMRVRVRAVFTQWNGVAGLDMLYVYCMATSHHTHVTPEKLGLPALNVEPFCDGLPLDQTTCPDKAGHM